jgi:hypothetical protein
VVKSPFERGKVIKALLLLLLLPAAKFIYAPAATTKRSPVASRLRSHVLKLKELCNKNKEMAVFLSLLVVFFLIIINIIYYNYYYYNYYLLLFLLTIFYNINIAVVAYIDGNGNNYTS